MMRTVEVLIVIIIITGAFIISSFFAVLPWPRQVSPVNLRRLALTTMQSLDTNFDLSSAAFENDSAGWDMVQTTLSASLPINVLYNMTVYEVNGDENGKELYTPVKTASNAESLGITSDASTYLVASSNVTYAVKPEKIGEKSGGITLYILNCSDANGWWITGYTAQSLAQDLYNLLSPFFNATVMVQTTAQLKQLFDNQTISGLPQEKVQNAVIINTFGESVPLPQEYHEGESLESQGYDESAAYPYVRYCYTVGQKTREYNWTWASIVGYPFYYVSNTAAFALEDNSWGIYGMRMTYQGGVRAFLQGLDNQPYIYDNRGLTHDPGYVTLTSETVNNCNYYGIYPSSYQTSTRALSTSVISDYNLTIGFQVFNQAGDYFPGTLYNHVFSGSASSSGSFLAIGLTRTPDIRITEISLLSYYKPRLYASNYGAQDSSRLVVLQLGLVGGT